VSTKNRPRIAVVGAGYWGPNWIRTILASSVSELAVVCDNNSQRLDFVKTSFPEVTVTDDYDLVISGNDVDAIILVTPPESHEELGIRALSSGKHTLVEKPMSVSVQAARNLLSTSEKTGNVLAVGHVFAYNPAVAAMKASLRSGELGTLKYANSSRMNMPPPNARHSVIWDLVVHDVSISLTLNDAMPKIVSGTGKNYRHRTLTDAATVTIEFDDGTMSWHHVGWLSAERIRRFFVGCESGAMEFDDTREEAKLKIYGTGVDSRLGGGNESASNLAYSAGDVSVPVLDTTSPLESELHQFVRAINGGPSPIANGEQGLKTVEILAAAEESIALGGTPISLENHDR